MNTNKIVGEGLAFDDVLLIPSYSETLPSEVDVSVNLAPGLKLAVPLLGAAMDTVVESEMAIALAREGALGIIHRNMSVTDQTDEIDKVKRFESGIIFNPITIDPNETMETALGMMRKYGISGIPVTRDGRLKGIITNRDLRFEVSLSRPVHELMTPMPLITVPEGTSLDEAKEILHKHRIEKLPVLGKDGSLKGLITIKDIVKRMECPGATKDAKGRLMVGAAVGTGASELDRASALVESDVDMIVVDSAHGHSKKVLDMIEALKNRFPNTVVAGGNVATADGLKAIADAGADVVKVGIGPGSICTTRVVAGVGIPQFTAILETCEVAERLGVKVVADGGIKYSGDIAKAIGAGADAVMVGSLFAGAEESPGDIILYKGRRYKEYRGMGSIASMKRGSADRYFQDDDGNSKWIPEGIEGRVPYKGPVRDIIHQLVGGLKAAMGYCGQKNIDSLKRNGRFIRITAAGLQESHPHSITITKEAPNYKVD